MDPHAHPYPFHAGNTKFFCPIVITNLGALVKESRLALERLAGIHCPRHCKCNRQLHGTREARKRFRRWLLELSWAVVTSLARTVDKVVEKWSELRQPRRRHRR